MKSLRVLQIVPSLSLVYGGPSQMVLGLSKSLAAQAIDVTILTTDANGDTGQAPLNVPLDRAVLQDGYRIRYFRCSPFRRYKFSPLLLNWLANHAHEYDIAHIHALFSPVSSAAAAIARWKKLPYILRPLGTLDPADLQKKKQLKRLYAALIERPNLAGAAAVHFTSDQEAKVSERFGTVTRDVVLPLGVELPNIAEPIQKNQIRSQLGLPLDQPLVLFMSRIDPKKGLDLLLPALVQLLAEGVEFHFVLAGANPQDPNYENQIRAQIQASPLAHCTTMTGFVTGAAKAQLLQAADLFVLPSYYENFGIAVAEAMAAGVPVIVSDQVHIWQEIAQAEAGWICTCEVDFLIQQLRFALADPASRIERGANAQTHALTHYSWQAIGQQMIQVYKSVLDRSQCAR
ncbi:hormogonium polysaccharide biosynthesis glycosyltransferase HpsP [Leptolyngbya sp. 7M]|uniref:hormogonium polysaccharide biosynthesis glycosyltransferase HpsP n=1 Tax=Leptolyngbya sp. 7M TaxID=2812896 RepID=UPI001B8CA564|nr:hormogonium polysaccharide biosynthesis glycosyltransferase HpsP [Leptolyngbya sp. 7M]QYO68119.1 hormogonium polysaccharide biosynthesis glycosyltransferase HpsP [Leptolyngbya sp. 7M]